MPAANTSFHREIRSLYSNHHDWLYGWLRKKLGCADNAADLAQDTFVRVLTREESIAVQEPRAFLTTVAQRVLSNHYRRQKIERAYLEALANIPQQQVPSPEARAVLLETLIEIDRRLGDLPAPVKKAFLRFQLDGVCQAEIAGELRVSVTTVKRYIVQAAQQCYFAD